MKLYILKHGYLTTDQEQVFQEPTSQGSEPYTPYKMPVYVVLIEHETGWILYDTGFHPDFARGIGKADQLRLFPATLPDSEELSRQLASLGLKPQDISAIILSHLHFDHIGQLSLFSNIPVYAPGSDLDAKPHFESEYPTLTFHRVYEDTELFTDVHLIKLPGHTTGLMGLMVQLRQSGALLFTSDASYSKENYLNGYLPCGCKDPEQYLSSIQRLHKLQEHYHAQVIYGHDQDIFKTCKYAPDCYI